MLRATIISFLLQLESLDGLPMVNYSKMIPLYRTQRTQRNTKIPWMLPETAFKAMFYTLMITVQVGSDFQLRKFPAFIQNMSHNLHNIKFKNFFKFVIIVKLDKLHLTLTSVNSKQVIQINFMLLQTHCKIKIFNYCKTSLVSILTV